MLYKKLNCTKKQLAGYKKRKEGADNGKTD